MKHSYIKPNIKVCRVNNADTLLTMSPNGGMEGTVDAITDSGERGDAESYATAKPHIWTE